MRLVSFLHTDVKQRTETVVRTGEYKAKRYEKLSDLSIINLQEKLGTASVRTDFLFKQCYDIVTYGLILAPEKNVLNQKLLISFLKMCIFIFLSNVRYRGTITKFTERAHLLQQVLYRLYQECKNLLNRLQF